MYWAKIFSTNNLQRGFGHVSSDCTIKSVSILIFEANYLKDSSKMGLKTAEKSKIVE